MMNYATDADRVMLKAMFMTPFWGGGGGARPAFLIDGLENDPLGNRGIGKTSITDALSLLCGDCVDMGKKTDPEDVKKRLLTCGDVRLVRMDNIKSSNLSNEALESLITIRRVNGHRMFIGYASIPNWFTYVMTFNDAEMSRDMAQRTMVIRLRRPTYTSNWITDVSNFIEKNRVKIIQDIAAELVRESAEGETATRFPAWERQVLVKAAGDHLGDVINNIKREQSETDNETHLTEDIREIMHAKISKYWRPANTGYDRIYLDPTDCSIAIKRSTVLGWVSDLLGGGSRRYIAKKFDQVCPSEFYCDAKIYRGDYYLIWQGGHKSRKRTPPVTTWRVSNEDTSYSLIQWDMG
jgi:hypothetical protein